MNNFNGLSAAQNALQAVGKKTKKAVGSFNKGKRPLEPDR